MARRRLTFLRLFLTGSVGLVGPLAHTAAAAPLAPQSVPGPDAGAAQSVVKGLVGAIRYGKDEIGAKRIGTTTMAKALLGPTWGEMNPGERDHFVTGLRKLLVATSFPRGREMFQYLDALLFAAPAKVGDQLQLPCTIVVHRELKKVEVPVTWVLGQEDGAWKVVDIVAQSESTTAGVREDEVMPLLKEGGVKKLLAVLDERLAKVAKADVKGEAAPATKPAAANVAPAGGT